MSETFCFWIFEIIKMKNNSSDIYLIYIKD